jgi:hypothetical protein
MMRIFKAFRKMLHARIREAHARDNLIAATALRDLAGKRLISG